MKIKAVRINDWYLSFAILNIISTQEADNWVIIFDT